MSGADDVVKLALKLVMGAGEKAAPKAKLPMDLDNRMYRASEMGFDPTRRYYHLTRKDFDAFKLGADPSSHTGGGAIWLRDDPRNNISAHQVPSFEAEGARDIPLFIRPTKELPTMEWSLLRQQGKLNDQFPLMVTPEENKMLRDMGYSHASMGGETVVFDPKDLRSPHAVFDPDEIESADYMKASGGRIAKGPGGWLDDVVKMAGKVISGEGEDAAKAGIRAYHGTWNDNLTGFDNSLLGQNFNNRASKAGHWFSTNPDDAAFFGDNVYEVELSGNYKTLPSMEEMGKNVREKLNNIVYNSKVNDDTSSAAAKYVDYLDATHAPSHYTNVTAAELSKARQAGFDGAKLKGGETVQNVSETGDHYVVFNPELIRIIRKLGIAGASAMLGYNLMEQLDPKQALAASMADQDYQSGRPQRSMNGNNSISGALNVARGLNGGE